jgi:sporulation-control protein spo0M
MFGKVKKMLGIEGVKIELLVDPIIHLESETVEGYIKLSTKTASTIESIHVKLIEKYSRGRNEEQLIDEYTLGETVLDEVMDIATDEIIEVPFSLTFHHARSDMDKMADGNILLRGPIKIAKWIKKVSSSYRIEVHANVQGTKLQPFAEKKLKAK